MIPKKVNVIKVPLAKDPGSSRPSTSKPELTRMPRMYLELIENKDKIKPSVVNKEYDPEEAQSVYSFDMNPHPSSSSKPFSGPQTIQEGTHEMEDEGYEQNSEAEDPIDEEESVNGSSVLSSEGRSEDHHDDDGEDNDEDRSTVSKETDDGEDPLSVSSEGTGRSSSVSGGNETDKRPKSHGGASLASEASSRSRSHHVTNTNQDQDRRNKTREKLKKLLSEEIGGAAGPPPGSLRVGATTVPKLSELHERGQVHHRKTVPNFNDHDTREDEEELKRELLFKFELLKKSYKTVQIPEFTMYSDYRNMNQTYENTLRQVSLDSNVESYKSLLVGGCMLLEFILGFWLKFDMSGFTQQQILNMNQYERLLIELGEKSYMPGGSQWPVELRLFGLLAMNAIIFIISKMILKKTGSNLVGLMNSVNHNFTQTAQKPKRRMRGPAIDVESIPDE